MKSTKRILALLLAAALVFSTGCSYLRGLIVTPSPAPSSAPSTSSTPSGEQGGEASLALAQLDREIFGAYATSDALSYHLLLAHPENFDGLEAPAAGWGTFSYADAQAETDQERAWYAQLQAIDRAALSTEEQLTLDTLEQYLKWNIEGFDYYYYSEVLDTLVGLHSNLPLNLTFYDIDSLEDVEGYLTLLADTPRLMELILRFEQEKSEAGLFMTDTALDEVLKQLEDVIKAGDTLFLRATFPEAIAQVEMDEKTRSAYEARNDELVDALIASYQTLYDGLVPLRGTAKNQAGLSAYGEQGLAYFEMQLKYNACSDITPAEAQAILEREIDAQIDIIVESVDNEPSVYDDFGNITLSLGTTQENLDYLEALMADYYPALPAHTVTFTDCPEELEDQFSPAAYLVPPVDDASENLIILNAKMLEEEPRLLDTLAHEGYPGHMYHYQYMRTLTAQTGYARQALDLTGYYESWSQAGEAFFDAYNTRFSNNYCRLMSANSLLGNLLLPALVSIRVNYDGDTLEDATALVAQYFDEQTAAEYGPILYQYAVENPFYFLKYAMGFSMLQQQTRKAQSALGASFDRLSFNKAFLDLGPTYFNFILPELDRWIEANKTK